MSINHFDDSVTALDSFLEGLAPTSQIVRQQALTPLSFMMGNSEMKGIDLKRSVGLFGVMQVEELPESPGPLAELMSLGLLIPVTDYAVFLENCKFRKPLEREDIARVQFGPAEFFVKDAGTFALLSPGEDPEAFVAFASACEKAEKLTAQLPTDEQCFAASKEAWMYINVKQAQKLLGPKLDEGFDTMRAGMSAAMMAQGQEEAPAFLEWSVDIYRTMASKLLAETDFGSMGVSLSADAINLTYSIRALPDTDMARWLSAESSPLSGGDLLPRLEDGAIMSMAGNLPQEIMKGMFEGFSKMFAAMELPEELKKGMPELNALMEKWMGCMGEDFAMSMRSSESKSPFAMDYYYEITDEALYQQAMDQLTEIANRGFFDALYDSFGMGMSLRVQRAISSYKEISIDQFDIKMGTNLPPETLAMMNTMYGVEGMKMQMALTDGLLIYAMGGDVESSLQRMIDEAKSGQRKSLSSEVEQGMKRAVDVREPSMLVNYNLVRLMQMSMRMMEELGGGDAADSLGIPTKSNFTFLGDLGEQRGRMEIILPKEHIKEYIECMKMMMQETRKKFEEATRELSE